MILIQHHAITECVKPMFDSVLTLRECEDDDLKMYAENIYSMLGSNIADLMGDRMDHVIQEFIDDASINNIRESLFYYINFNCKLKLLSTI